MCVTERWLVTGGGGFIGSHLVETLVDRGTPVVVLDDFSTGKRANLKGLGASVEVIEASVCDFESLSRTVQGVSVVVHLAALPSVPRSVRDPKRSNAVNVDGTLNTLLAAKESSVRRVICASSSSIYGDQPDAVKIETQRPCPRSPYAVSKLAAESYCAAFHAVYGLDTLSLRFFNVFGPRQDAKSEYAAVVPKFVTSLLDGNGVTIHGDGLQTRDFTYVGNVVEAIIRASQAEAGQGEAFNIAGGNRTSIQDLAEYAGELTGVDLPPTYEPARPGDVRHSLADVQKATTVLGYEPRIGVREGLRKTVEWFVEQHGSE